MALALAAAMLVGHLVRLKAGDVSATYYVTESTYWALPLHRFYRPGRIQLQSGPYDGAFFLLQANDPLLRQYEDQPRFHRGRRIFWPWAAWLLGAGQPEAILYTLPILTLAMIGVGSWVLARLLMENGHHPAWSLLNAFALGTAISLMRSVADAFALNLLLAGAYAWYRDWTRLGVVLFALAGLSKETSLLVPFVLFMQLVREGRWRRARVLCAAPAAVLTWWAILRTGSPDGYFGWNFGLPFAGIYDVVFVDNPRKTIWPLAAMITPILIVLLATPRAWTRWRFVTLAYAAMAILADRVLWEEYWAYGRAFAAIPAFLLFGFAIDGRKLDLVGPIVVALSGVLIWALWM